MWGEKKERKEKKRKENVFFWFSKNSFQINLFKNFLYLRFIFPAVQKKEKKTEQKKEAIASQSVLNLDTKITLTFSL
jgi:hypothetical protein